MKLSPISLAVLPLLTVFTANAAVYQIVELDLTNQVQTTSGVATTAQGGVVANGNVFFDFEIDLTAIDFESAAIKAILTEQQIADALNGVVDNKVQAILINYLNANAGVQFQPVGRQRVLLNTANGQIEHIVFRDSSGTKNNNEFAYDVNEQGLVVGIASAPATKGTFIATIVPGEGETEPEIPVIPQPVTVWVPAPGFLLGYAADSNRSVLLPPAFTGLGGGMSVAQAINNTNLIAGYTSTGASSNVTDIITSLCNGNLQPQQFCFNTQMSSRSLNLNVLLGQVQSFQTVNITSQGYQERGALWQLNNDGTATLSATLGFLGEKGTGVEAASSEEFSAPFYYSRASDINDSNIAVGHSLYSDVDRKLSVFDAFGTETRLIYAAPHATIFNGDDVTGFIDTNEWLASIATNINEQNLVTGYALKNINGAVRSRLFTYDINSSSLEFPNGFFNSSSTEPKAINNSGQVVGRAEVLVAGTISRRFHAFLYDANTKQFTDLNQLVGCDAPMLVEANDINDDGVILATALINRPLLGARGEEQLAEDGTVIKQVQATTVKLRPIPNGQPEDCNAPDTTYERSSGSLSFFWLMLIGALPFIRRRKAK